MHSIYHIVGFYCKELINNQYIAILKSALFNALLLTVAWETVKTMFYCRIMSLWDYFKQKGSLPNLQPIFHCKHGSHVYRNPDANLPGVSVHITNPIIAHDVNITLAPWPRVRSRKSGCLIVLISLCGGRFGRLGLIIDTLYFTRSNQLRDFKFVKAVRSWYLLLLYILLCIT